MQNRALRFSGETHGESTAHDEVTAPQYLVYPVRWCDVDSRHISPEPCLIDFGESFKASDPPEDLGIPAPYRSPEIILEKTAGVGSDLWALGCTLFEIRTGRKMFNLFDDDDDAYLDAMVQVLGPPRNLGGPPPGRDGRSCIGTHQTGRAVQLPSQTTPFGKTGVALFTPL